MWSTQWALRSHSCQVNHGAFADPHADYAINTSFHQSSLTPSEAVKAATRQLAVCGQVVHGMLQASLIPTDSFPCAEGIAAASDPRQRGGRGGGRGTPLDGRRVGPGCRAALSEAFGQRAGCRAGCGQATNRRQQGAALPAHCPVCQPGAHLTRPPGLHFLEELGPRSWGPEAKTLS